jgi:hypothetical protein
MGQGYKRKTYKLKWPEGHDLHGLEVATKGLSVEATFELASLAAGLGADVSTEEKVRTANQLFAGFAERLVSWNLTEDDDTPVPATLAGVQDQDMGFMIGLITTWMDAVSSVDTPLPQGSANGQSTAPEASLPTESLSPSLQS